MKTPILETPRLTLMPVTLADAPAIQKYFNNWNIIKDLSMAVPWPYPDNGAETFLRDIALPKVRDGKAHTWAIRIKDGPDEAVGIVDYREEPTEEGHRGFWIAEPFWGRGYMTEAVEAVQDFLFFDLGIEAMQVVNVKSNLGSRRVKQKTGARYLKTIELPHRCGDNETEVWEITRESWRAHRDRKTV